MMIEFNHQQIPTDKEGYLLDSQQWTPELAPVIAAKENINLTDAHWEVVHFVRDFYIEFDTSPAIRMLVKAMAKNSAKTKETACIYISYSRKALPSKPPK